MNDQHFFDLAMKVITGLCTETERAELDSLIASSPDLKAEWERLQGEAKLAREIVPLVEATHTAEGELPAYARERLQTKVRRTLGRPEVPRRKPQWMRAWILGLAAATAVVMIVAITVATRPSRAVIQVAVLDTAGVARGADDAEARLLNQHWQNAATRKFERAADLAAWEQDWPKDGGTMVKIVFDRAAGELRVAGFADGRRFAKSFPVETNLAAAIQQADSFIREQTKK